jgi:hypothetical protein
MGNPAINLDVVMSIFFNMDSMIGKDFEAGLARSHPKTRLRVISAQAR